MAELIDNSGYQDFTLETLQTPDGLTRLNGIIRQLAQNISSDTESVRIFQGYGTPEASIAAGVGSLYMRVDGGADTSVYRKESGSGNTGWVAIKAPASLPLSVANGGTGVDNSAVAQGSLLYFSATGVVSILGPGTSGQYLKTQGSSANPIFGMPSGFSNVIFNFVGLDNGTITAGVPSNGTYGFYDGSTTKKESAMACNTGNTPGTAINLTESFRWVKIPGVNTLTVMARAYASTVNCFLRLDVNSTGLISNKALTGGSVYTNETAFTLDVSSLTNGTSYPVVFYGYDSTNNQSLIKVSQICLMGS